MHHKAASSTDADAWCLSSRAKVGTCPLIKMHNTFQEGSAIHRKARSCGISVVILLDGKQLCILISHNITRCHCERIVTGDHKPDTWGLRPSCPVSSSFTWHLRNLIALCSHSRSRSQLQVLIPCACKSVFHQTLPRDFIALRRHSCPAASVKISVSITTAQYSALLVGIDGDLVPLRRHSRS